VNLKDGQEFGLLLINEELEMARFDVTINGDFIGRFISQCKTSNVIYRGVNSKRGFKCVKMGSAASAQANGKPGNVENGIIKVIYQPTLQQIETKKTPIVSSESSTPFISESANLRVRRAATLPPVKSITVDRLIDMMDTLDSSACTITDERPVVHESHLIRSADVNQDINIVEDIPEEYIDTNRSKTIVIKVLCVD
jgi:hypothetical protein